MGRQLRGVGIHRTADATTRRQNGSSTEGHRLRALVLGALLTLTLLGLSTSPATADTPAGLTQLPTLDELNRSETPLSNGGKWSAVSWAIGTKTGQDTTSGWGPYNSFAEGANGAYWNPATFKDAGNGDAAAITMQTAPGKERYVSLWLNMSSPGSAKSGYELRWTETST